MVPSSLTCSSQILDVAFSPDLLALCTLEGDIEIYDSQYQIIKNLKLHKKSVRALAFESTFGISFDLFQKLFIAAQRIKKYPLQI